MWPMKRIILLLFLLVQVVLAAAQTDSVAWSTKFVFREGIYLTEMQFRCNRPIPASRLVSNYDTTALDFLHKATALREVVWRDSAGIQHDTLVKALFGYCENQHIYLRAGGNFVRLMVIGSLCHFTTTETNYLYTGGPGVGGNTPVQQLQQYVYDAQTGAIRAFTLLMMQSFLQQRDPALYAEFMQLRKRQRNQQLFIYLRKYNERHPLYFYTS